VDRGTQTVFKFGDRVVGSTYHFKKCAVADRLNWSCHYNDDSGIVEVTESKYRGITLNEHDRELDKKSKYLNAKGQVDYLRWLELYLPFFLPAWMRGSLASRDDGKEPEITNSN